jgi:putative tryptophan/tyrosine transport system substrate-binding protein
LRRGLRELGWVDGQNIAIEYRWAADREEQLPALAAELVQLKVDIIVTSSTPAARAAKQATTTVPIVITFVADPVGSGLVASLARPGGNITGVSTLARGLVTKRLELLRAVVPKSQRIGVLWQPGAHGERTIRELMEETKAASGALGLQLEFVEARRADDLELAFSRMSNAHIDGVLVFPSPMLFDVRESLVAHAAKVRLPAVYSWRETVDAEGSCLTLRTFQTCTAAQQFTWTSS